MKYASRSRGRSSKKNKASGEPLFEIGEKSTAFFTPLQIQTQQSSGVRSFFNPMPLIGRKKDKAVQTNGEGKEEKKKKLPDSFKVTGMEKIEGAELYLTPDAKKEHEIHPSDITQGQMADCFLASALATIANQNPKVISDAISSNEDGTYSVKLYKNKDAKLIAHTYKVVPEFGIAERVRKGKKDTVKAHMDVGDVKEGKKEIWPLVIEKAYAQMIGGGDAAKGLEKLNTGGDPQKVLEALSGKKGTETAASSLTIKNLAKMHKTGQAVTFVSLAKGDGKDKKLYKKGKLTEWHIYYLLKVDTEKKEVTLGNPWGWGREVVIDFSDIKDNFRSIKANPIPKKEA